MVAVSFMALPLWGLAARNAAAGILHDGSWYELTSAAMTWDDAESEAISRGGHLAAINSAAEQSFINDTFLPPPVPRILGRPLWIGLNDAASEGTFVWSNGDALTYSNWSPGQPDNASGGEDYVAIDWQRAITGEPDDFGQWNDTPAVGASFGPYFGIIEAPNLAPVASISGLENLTLGDVLLLDGKRSFDPNAPFGDFITFYGWDLNFDGMLDFGTESPLLELTSAQYASYFSAPGSYVLGLLVTDAEGQAGVIAASLDVIAPKSPPPTADAPEPASLALFGVGSLGLLFVRRRKTAS